MQLSKDRIGALALLAFSLAYGYFIKDIPPPPPILRDNIFNATTIPTGLAILGVLLSLALLFAPSSGDKPEFRGLHWGVFCVFIVLMSIYGFALRPVGFVISTITFLVIGFMILGERRPSMLLGVSVPLVVAFWQLMERVLDVSITPWPIWLAPYVAPLDQLFDAVEAALRAVFGAG